EAFWAAMEGRPEKEAADAIKERVSLEPHAGMPVWETLLFRDPARAGLASRILESTKRRKHPDYAPGFARLEAWLARHQGRPDEARAALDRALEALGSVDEMNAVPWRREIEELRDSWQRR
ncbi:MAG: hypothetical protein L0216_10575, partial [Planctomycetales bacterium]|nr:hypothetical protein [Planctomycetales bacterium]